MGSVTPSGARNHVGVAPTVGGKRPRSSFQQRRRRRRIVITLMILGGCATSAVGWIIVTGQMARGELDTVRSEIHQLRTDMVTGQLGNARKVAIDIGARTRRAHQLTTGPAWTVAAAMPSVGDPLQIMRGITGSADVLGNGVLPQLVYAAAQLNPMQLRLPDGSLDLAQVAGLAPTLRSATAALSGAADRVQQLPAHTWLAAVDGARTDLLSQLNSLQQTLRAANLTARIVPTMLGLDVPQTYFVAFQNDAESRGTGGLPGAFAIVAADHGKLKFDSFHSVGALAGSHADVNFGPDYDHLYRGAGTTTLYGNGNLSPNFPYAAQIWASMWKMHSGQQVDGVIAVDPTALSYLLTVTGPAELADKTKVTAANVVALTQSTVYAKFPATKDTNVRHSYLLDIARAVSTRLVAKPGSTVALIAAAGRAADERRLLIWSDHPTIQTDLTQTALAGEIPNTPAPYVGLSIVNDGGNKLDYYLGRTLSWKRTGCGASRQVTATITLTNNAPPTGLSDYVTYRTDQRSYPVHRGDNRLEVGYLATAGALLTSITIDNRPGTAAIGAERGHPVYTIDLELPRATTRTLVLHLVEPPAAGPPIVLRQPLIRPLSITINDNHCN